MGDIYRCALVKARFQYVNGSENKHTCACSPDLNREMRSNLGRWLGFDI